MILEFRIHKLKEDGHHWKYLKKYNNNNEFIIIGKEKKYKEVVNVLKVHQLDKHSELKLFSGCKLNEMTSWLEEEELIPTDRYVEFDICKERITLEIIEEIAKYNRTEGPLLQLEDVLLKELQELTIPE